MLIVRGLREGDEGVVRHRYDGFGTLTRKSAVKRFLEYLSSATFLRSLAFQLCSQLTSDGR